MMTLLINEILPNELISYILEFVSNDHFDLNIQLVCKLWYELYNNPYIRGKELELDKIRFKTVKKVLSLPKFQCLRSLSLSNIDGFSDDSVAELSKLCFSKTLKRLGFSLGETSSRTLKIIGKSFPKLRSLMLLQKSDWAINSRDWNYLVNGCTNLRTLVLWNVSKFPMDMSFQHSQLRFLWLYNAKLSSKFWETIGKSLSLKSLNLEDCEIVNDESLRLLAEGGKCSTLQKLDIEWYKRNKNSITNTGLKYIIKGFPYLQRLNIPGDQLTNEGLKDLHKLQFLNDLEIPYCKNITDVGIALIAKCTSITKLGVSYSRITKIGLEALNNIQLEYLDFHGVSTLSHSDFIAWMKKKYKTITATHYRNWTMYRVSTK